MPRLKLALPAAASYWVHALGGAPLLCLHRQVDDGMVREIWQRIVPQLEELGLVPQEPVPAAEPLLTLVFDREGWKTVLEARDPLPGRAPPAREGQGREGAQAAPAVRPAG